MDIQKYVKNALNKSLNIEQKNRKPIIALIGLGPHAKRIYLNYFKKHKINFALVVDLDSQKSQIRDYLNENGFFNTKVFTIKGNLKDCEHMPKKLTI